MVRLRGSRESRGRAWYDAALRNRVEKRAAEMRQENAATFRRKDAALTGWRRRRVAYLAAKLAAQMEGK